MLKKILFFSLAFSFTIGILDLYLQSAEIQFRALGIYDEKEGFRLMPDQEYTFFKEGFSISETSNLGFYGEDVNINKPESVYRIALLGDSYVEGLQVFDRDHFRSVIERKLSLSTNHVIEVLNCGMSGFSISDMYCYYSSFVKKLDPDLTVIVIRQSDLELKKRSPLQPFCYIEKGQLKIDKSYLQSKQYQKKVRTQFYRGKSAVGDILSKCNKIVKRGEYGKILFGKFANIFYNIPSQKDGQKNFLLPDINKKILDELRRQNVIVAYFGHMGEGSLLELRQFGDNLIDLNIVLTKLRKEGINPNYWKASDMEGHWNHSAHTAIGEYLSVRIDEILYSGVRIKE